MRRYIRAASPGASYFFTVVLQDRAARWLTEHVSELSRCVARVKAAHPFDIDAMVVLPDHLHALWTLPPDDANYPLRWMLIKRSFTQRLASTGMLERRALARRGLDERSLWQRRYWEHQIRNDEDFARHVDYIHFNPVKHGWAHRAVERPYSSFHRFVRQGILPCDWGPAGEQEDGYGE